MAPVAPAVLMAGKALKFLPYITGTLGGVQGFRQGGLGGAVGGIIGGIFCDIRLKEDIAPLWKSEVNDVLSECAFFVKDLNECS